MTSKSIATEEWTCFYDAVNQLSAVRKNSQLVSEYGYDGDGKRVWAIDYESSVAQKETIYIGNYFEFVREDEAAGQGEGAICESPDYCTYLPMIFQMPRGISYYYADGQRIAMRDKNGVVSYLYGDQLGGVSAVADASGNLVSTTLYEPWGATRYENGDNITEYGYTGQMQEGDIYFYNARWYDPSIGRFMQADTIIPLQVQGTQAFDRYAYVNNNPINYVDPGGDFAITTAILIGVGVGALAGYAGQVIHNLNNNMSFKEALTTDISAGWIVGGAVAGGVLGGMGFALGSYLATGAIPITSSLCLGKCTEVVKNSVEVTQKAGEVVEELFPAIENMIDTGANYVYPVVENGVTKYVGITNNLSRRAIEHLSNTGWVIERIPGLENLSRFDARAVEQFLIEQHGLSNLFNKINSIAQANPIYENAIQRAGEILRTITFIR